MFESETFTTKMAYRMCYVVRMMFLFLFLFSLVPDTDTDDDLEDPELEELDSGEFKYTKKTEAKFIRHLDVLFIIEKS